jgi:CubicO group peptidase (beta-lactamase class C family)
MTGVTRGVYNLPMSAFIVVALLSIGQAPSSVPATPDEKLKAKWEKIFREADKDESRSLTLAEARKGLPKVLVRRFDRIDLDKDGEITPEELWAMHEREVAERERRRKRGGKTDSA